MSFEIKNPFTPIVTEEVNAKGSSQGAINMYKEEMKKEEEKLKQQELHPEGVPTQNDESFQPELKQEPKRQSKKINIHIDEERDISVTQKGWSKLLSVLILETFNAEKSLLDVSEEVKGILSNQGIDANIDEYIRKIEQTQERLLRLSVAKSMANSLGLTNEWEKILEREMDAIYPKKSLEISNPNLIQSKDS